MKGALVASRIEKGAVCLKGADKFYRGRGWEKGGGIG